MERSFSSLTYKGSIPEAINEAKIHKKLLVVYISGKDTESNNLENATWTDLKVIESVTKYCILLHIQEGSTDAANFSAIYPQTSTPCITAIGYNGLQAWRSEGFVSADVLASSLEKAWLSLHIQETTASVLTAALASNKSELPTSGMSVSGSSERGSSSGAAVPSPSLENLLQSREAKSSVTSEMENNTESGVRSTSKFLSDSQSRGVGDELYPTSKGADSSLNDEAADPEISQAENISSGASHSPAPGRTGGCHSSVPTVARAEANEALENQRVDGTATVDRKVDMSGSSGRVSESTDVHLNIRLPNGVSLREKFSMTSALRVVKDYVDRNQTDISPYDLAVPYPRKIFTDEDFSKSLLDLSMFDKQTLIVVPRQRALGYHGGGSMVSEQTSPRTDADSSNGSLGGYFAYVRRLVSYANPFSYFSGGASSSGPRQDSQTGIWEYGPNPTLQNNLASGDRPSHDTSSGRNESKNMPASSSHFGSNIHTLKHDEDDSRFSDRNAYWNGNSTQYGGDSNSR